LEQSVFRSDAQSGAVTPEALAAVLMGLPATDRARLATMLLGQQPEG
jgi:hypothetical protein